MSVLTKPEALYLQASTAAELMAPNPISLRAQATVEEAMALLTEKGIAAAPVIDDVGRPVGVVSRSDLFIHQIEKARREPHNSEAPSKGARATPTVAPMKVADVMTPAVFAVSPDAPVTRIVGDMLGLHVHRLFVVDETGVLVGVITAMDVLKRLQPE